MANVLRWRPLQISLMVTALGWAFPLRAAESDLFDGLFRKRSHTAREDIKGLNGKGSAGYRVTLLFSTTEKDSDAFRASLPPIAEKRLRMAGYEVLISRSLLLDLTLPATCNIVVRKEGKMIYFSSVAINGKDGGCFVTYEVNSDR